MPRALCLTALLLAGCQKAGPYTPRLASGATEAPRGGQATEREAPLAPDLAWMGPGRLPARDVRIVFVHESAPEWAKLLAFWNESPAAGKEPAVVRVRVPVGLGDPTPHVPPASPMTRSRWELGRELFFDPTWLTAGGEQACSTCHDPARGLSDGKATSAGGYNSPTLVNVAYSRRLFWDGRASYLEEVVQAAPEDEREPKRAGPFRHVWPGVVGRLRASARYKRLFQEAFGTPPTQSAVGQAVATYLRTLLVGNSTHDRAVREQRRAKAAALTAAHYEAVLDGAALEALRASRDRKAVAGRLAQGLALFNGKALCARCHPGEGGLFTDGAFHNIGVEAERVYDADSPRLGRFAVAPFGEKEGRLLGAYKTPTLRGLLRSGPYFHDGHEKALDGAVRYHVRPPRGATRNLYLDPLLAAADGSHRDLKLTEDEVQSLALFLRALNGDEVDRFVTTSPRR
jgi:cytochrome c peroxidase